MQKAELRPVFLSNKTMRRELTPNYFQSILHFWHFPLLLLPGYCIYIMEFFGQLEKGLRMRRCLN